MRAALLALTVSVSGPLAAHAQQWPVHAMDRPRPPVVNPGPERPPVPPPSDAVILFNGTTLDGWEAVPPAPPAPGAGVSRPAGWKVQDGFLEVVPGSGSIRTRQPFGDVQLHLEWAAPNPPRGSGQDRGNSGVFLMSRYEVQVLDSWRNDTYADGQAAALYGQYPPLVNATRPPGQWQTYDIIFRRPWFRADGQLVRPARVTVLHNGIVVHDAVPLKGATAHAREAAYEAHEDALPLMLQDHDHPVRFRNIWVRELPPE